eukprot:CAMPEP_0179469260 /NCGR_PEP_ID=MMETSP0799-20121207/49999_1 /TAXON_ID=46947 /ORGANISM="Geminigera cryophila, Strain CCMP2564" /LENGTH=60 /DNA_ID=CAMNT_0021275711 /DNA_START=1225 /DNA_END=1404 /DNA_ORIENTATION=-
MPSFIWSVLSRVMLVHPTPPPRAAPDPEAGWIAFADPASELPTGPARGSVRRAALDAFSQ